MIYLYYLEGDYCLSNPYSHKVGLWNSTPGEAVVSYFECSTPCLTHSTFFYTGYTYTLVMTFPVLTSLKDFHDQFPEIFI
jgi:hypothetical protein